MLCPNVMYVEKKRNTHTHTYSSIEALTWPDGDSSSPPTCFRKKSLRKLKYILFFRAQNTTMVDGRYGDCRGFRLVQSSNPGNVLYAVWLRRATLGSQSTGTFHNLSIHRQLIEAKLARNQLRRCVNSCKGRPQV